MKRMTLFLGVFIVLISLVSCGQKQQLVGNDRDIHGCKGSAGYSWCEAKQKCLRTWEENCTSCGTCPMWSSPAPGWCANGTIIAGEKNSCGCQGPPRCITEDIFSCTADSDCIPLPSECHPMECINKKFESNYVKPEMCTMMFAVDAAYTPEDCACVANKCINKNKGKSSEAPQGKIAPGAVIDSYEGCVAAGGPVMESYPRKCSYQGTTYTETLSGNEGHICTAEESQQTACTLEYMPVCGKIILNTGKEAYQTFGNGCAACAAMKVVSYTQGECANKSVTSTNCTCPEGYRKDGDACNPECYYSTLKCLMPSVKCE